MGVINVSLIKKYIIAMASNSNEGDKYNNDNDQYDNRPLVCDLIKEYINEIIEVRKQIQDNEFYIPNRHDDIWILRFLLSHCKKNDNNDKGTIDKMTANAAKAAIKTM